MDRLHDAAPPRHALQPSAADAYAFETGRPAVSEGTALVAVALLAGAPALGTDLALLKGPWILMLVLLHVGGLALWFGLSGRDWRDLLTGGGIRSRTVLFAAGALGGVAFGGLHTWMGPTGTGPLWKPEITASTTGRCPSAPSRCAGRRRRLRPGLRLRTGRFCCVCRHCSAGRAAAPSHPEPQGEPAHVKEDEHEEPLPLTDCQGSTQCRSAGQHGDRGQGDAFGDSGPSGLEGVGVGRGGP